MDIGEVPDGVGPNPHPPFQKWVVRSQSIAGHQLSSLTSQSFEKVIFIGIPKNVLKLLYILLITTSFEVGRVRLETV